MYRSKCPFHSAIGTKTELQRNIKKRELATQRLFTVERVYYTIVLFVFLVQTTCPYVAHCFRDQPKCTFFAHATKCLYKTGNEDVRKITGCERLDANCLQRRFHELLWARCHPRCFSENGAKVEKLLDEMLTYKMYRDVSMEIYE